MTPNSSVFFGRNDPMDCHVFVLRPPCRNKQAGKSRQALFCTSDTITSLPRHSTAPRKGTSQLLLLAIPLLRLCSEQQPGNKDHCTRCALRSNCNHIAISSTPEGLLLAVALLRLCSEQQPGNKSADSRGEPAVQYISHAPRGD